MDVLEKRNKKYNFHFFCALFSDTDSVMAVVIDIAPSPLENRCFFKLMREIVEHLDTGNLSHDREEGDPIFRTTDDAEYERLKDLQI